MVEVEVHPHEDPSRGLDRALGLRVDQGAHRPTPRLGGKGRTVAPNLAQPRGRSRSLAQRTGPGPGPKCLLVRPVLERPVSPPGLEIGTGSGTS